MDRKYTREQIKDAIWNELKESEHTGENNDRAYEIIGIVMAGLDAVDAKPVDILTLPVDYPGSSYQNLFDYLHEEHGLTLLESEMNDLINVVHKYHPAGAGWVKTDTKPEYNVGVLVFIPGEDNHITSGMWDISNEWVLLDEYRTPEEEVTHWMPLPAFPEGYTSNEMPGELIDVLKKVAKEELSKRESSPAAREEDWISVEDQLPYRDGDSSVYCIVYDVYWGVVVRPYNEAHNCWDGEDGDDYYTEAKGGKITHWKPIPESPFKQLKQK